jgi:hypothetical protein
VRRGHGEDVRLIRKVHGTEDMALNIVDQDEGIAGGSCPVPTDEAVHAGRLGQRPQVHAPQCLQDGQRVHARHGKAACGKG